MPHTRTKTWAALFFISAVVLSASLSASDSELAADFHDQIANGFCVPEILAEADTQFSRCKFVLESPVSFCANETGMYDYITADESPEEEWEAELEAVSEIFSACLFSELETASENAGNRDRAIYTALIDNYGPLQEFEEPESEFFTDDQVASGKLDEYFAEQARVMNEGLPMMVDDLSRLERVTYSDRVFREYYTFVGVTRDEVQNVLDPDVVDQFFTSSACNHEPSRNAMRKGIEFAYEFWTEDGYKHAEVSVSSEDCESSK